LLAALTVADSVTTSVAIAAAAAAAAAADADAADAADADATRRIAWLTAAPRSFIVHSRSATH
jgi:hypothetical protein